MAAAGGNLPQFLHLVFEGQAEGGNLRWRDVQNGTALVSAPDFLVVAVCTRMLWHDRKNAQQVLEGEFVVDSREGGEPRVAWPPTLSTESKRGNSPYDWGTRLWFPTPDRFIYRHWEYLARDGRAPFVRVTIADGVVYDLEGCFNDDRSAYTEDGKRTRVWATSGHMQHVRLDPAKQKGECPSPEFD